MSQLTRKVTIKCFTTFAEKPGPFCRRRRNGGPGPVIRLKTMSILGGASPGKGPGGQTDAGRKVLREGVVGHNPASASDRCQVDLFSLPALGVVIRHVVDCLYRSSVLYMAAESRGIQEDTSCY